MARPSGDHFPTSTPSLAPAPPRTLHNISPTVQDLIFCASIASLYAQQFLYKYGTYDSTGGEVCGAIEISQLLLIRAEPHLHISIMVL
jgi:hypothetical protein